MTAAVLIDAGGDAVLAFDFDACVVEQLKREIPASFRSWQPERKTWQIAAPFVSVAIEILADTFGDVHIDDARKARHTPRSSAPVDAYAVLHLRESAPGELVTAAYRVLARIHHPDAGGSTTTMQAINRAYEEVKP